MPENPLISIITPSYNQGQFIEETIQSVLNQSYKNIQYILIDGGSTDHTMDIVNKYRHKIDIVIHEKDKGQSNAINKGFKLARGNWLGWLNSDDILYFDAIERIITAIHQSAEDVAVIMPSKVNWIDEHSNFMKTVSISSRYKQEFVNKNYNIIQPGSFFNRKHIQQSKLINEDLHYSMDLDLILRLLNYGQIKFIEHPVSGFRIWQQSKTATGSKAFLKEIKKTLSHNGMRLFSSNYLRLNYYGLKTFVKRNNAFLH